MLRRIIKIDAAKCNGCGLCVQACHEGAIGLEDGKARLLRDDYCDGLGDCLPACPTGAITFEEREALPYDEGAVEANMRSELEILAEKVSELPRGCSGNITRCLDPQESAGGLQPLGVLREENLEDPGGKSALRHWPVQLKLAPSNAPYLENADLLIAADCTAYAYANFQAEFMQGKVTLIGCPKLDRPAYSEKLLEIFSRNALKSVTVARMSVPCCGGLEQAATGALRDSGKNIPLGVVTFSPEGNIII